jgi:hypothetical protein
VNNPLVKIPAYRAYSDCELFQQDFNEFRDDWDARLESSRREMDLQRDPRIRVKSSVENNRSFKVLGLDTTS